jgi:uncharacterized protein YjbJ (UPF0337 family)
MTFLRRAQPLRQADAARSPHHLRFDYACLDAPDPARIVRRMTPKPSNWGRIAKLSSARHPPPSGAAARFVKSRRHAMNWDQIQGNWVEFKAKVHQNWVKLTDEDLTRIGGRRQELADRLRARYGFAKAEAEREIEAWVKTQRRAA